MKNKVILEKYPFHLWFFLIYVNAVNMWSSVVGYWAPRGVVRCISTILIQMPQTYWLSHCTLSAISVQLLEFAYKVATFFCFYTFSNEHLETYWIIHFPRRLKDGYSMLHNFKKLNQQSKHSYTAANLKWQFSPRSKHEVSFCIQCILLCWEIIGHHCFKESYMCS